MNDPVAPVLTPEDYLQGLVLVEMLKHLPVETRYALLHKLRQDPDCTYHKPRFEVVEHVADTSSKVIVHILG